MSLVRVPMRRLFLPSLLLVLVGCPFPTRLMDDASELRRQNTTATLVAVQEIVNQSTGSQATKKAILDKLAQAYRIEVSLADGMHAVFKGVEAAQEKVEGLISSFKEILK